MIRSDSARKRYPPPSHPPLPASNIKYALALGSVLLLKSLRMFAIANSPGRGNSLIPDKYSLTSTASLGTCH